MRLAHVLAALLLALALPSASWAGSAGLRWGESGASASGPGGGAIATRITNTATVSTSDGATWTAIPGLTIPVEAAKKYVITCNLRTTTAGTTLVGVQIQALGPPSPTRALYVREFCNTNDPRPTTFATNAAFHIASTDDGAGASSGTGVNCEDRILISLWNGASGGDITFGLQTETGGTSVSVLSGSFCERSEAP